MLFPFSCYNAVVIAIPQLSEWYYLDFDQWLLIKDHSQNAVYAIIVCLLCNIPRYCYNALKCKLCVMSLFFFTEYKVSDLARKMEKQFAERAVKKPPGGVSVLPERADEVQELSVR